jgi:nucleoside transporter
VDRDANLTIREELELMGMLFLHGMALASWFVPLGSVLDQASLGSLKPFAFASFAVAALLSPLFFGAMADRSVPPAKVLRWISVATACMVAIIAYAIEHRASRWIVLGLIQVQALFCSPTGSLAGSIVFAQLVRSKKSFGAIRSLGTIGWMVGCWTVSLFHFDSTPKAFYVSSFLWILLALFTLRLPHADMLGANTQRLTLRERFGWDALSLLRDHNHRVVFLAAALIAIPFAAFYPHTPPHLSSLGLERVSAWMSLGQVSEVLALLCVGAILRNWNFKTVIAAGIGFGVLRYALYSTNSTISVLIGLGLHGVAFTFTYVCTQIYFAERIEPAWRTRAQALLSMMTSGIGNLAGYLGCGVWYEFCRGDRITHWSVFWAGLCALVLLVLVYFVLCYREKSADAPPER